MKKLSIVLLLAFMLIGIKSFCQDVYKFEKTDSVKKNKNQIYSDTKMFIAEYWKSAQSVIQNDDKEGGMILIKGNISIQAGSGAGSGPWPYSYTIKFLIKENRYKIVISNITPELFPGTNKRSPEICNGCEFPGAFKIDMFKAKWKDVQANFPIEMQKIMSDYSNYLQKESKANGDW